MDIHYIILHSFFGSAIYGHLCRQPSNFVGYGAQHVSPFGGKFHQPWLLGTPNVAGLLGYWFTHMNQLSLG